MLLWPNIIWGFQVAQWQRVRLPMQEMWVWSLGWEDLLEAAATCPSALAWRIPWHRRLAGCSPWGCKESHTNEHAWTHTHTKYGPTIPGGLWLILDAKENRSSSFLGRVPLIMPWYETSVCRKLGWNWGVLVPKLLLTSCFILGPCLSFSSLK